MSSGKKKLAKLSLRGKDLKVSHERTEGLLGADHQQETDTSKDALAKGQADLDKSRAVLMDMVWEHDKKQRAQDEAQEKHDHRQDEHQSEMKGLRNAHKEIQDEDALDTDDE